MRVAFYTLDVYKRQGFDGAQGAQTQSADDGVVDADYEVVDDDKK